MTNRKFLIFSMVVLLMPLFSILSPLTANATDLPAITIVPVEEAVSTNMNLCYGWASDDLIHSDDLVVGFFYDPVNAGKRFSLSGLTASEVTFYIDSDDCGDTQGGSYEARLTEAAPGTDNNDHDALAVWAAGAVADNYTFAVINLDSDVVIADTTPISIGFANVAGDSVLTPTEAGNYKTLIEQYDSTASPATPEWLETQLLYIGDLNDVNITATLDPSISVDIDNNTCDLEVLSTTVLKTCEFRTTITTNIGTGYTSYIEQDHSFDNTVNGVTHEMGVPTDNQIEGSGDLDGTYGEYGIGIKTDDTTSWPEWSLADCVDNYDGLTTTLEAKEITGDNTRSTLTSYTTPVNGVSHGLIDFCAGARIKYDAPPGVYAHTITITVVGNF